MGRFKVVLVVYLVSFCTFFIHAQDKEKGAIIDFGFVDRFHSRLAETFFVNTTDKTWDLLRWEKENTIDLKVNSRKVEAGDTLHILLKLNPTEEGPYASSVKFIFGKHQQEIEVKAVIRHVDLTANTPCPDFEKSDSKTRENWKAAFRVRDRLTGATLSDVTISLQGMKGGSFVDIKTDKQGIAEAEVPIDYYMMRIRHSGYAAFQLETYINKHQKDILIELTPGKGSVVVRRPGSGVDVSQGQNQVSEDVTVKKIPIEEAPQSEVTPISEFNEREYRLNNITFLIDISTSMRQGHKMDILKASLHSLIDMLRAEDKVSIITYASSTSILGSGMSGAHKEDLHEMITSLQAEGLTAGEAGLKKAYGQSKKHFIPQGNNQVFLITDGALQKGYDKVMKMATDQAENRIHLSVIAIDANKWAEQKMKDLAAGGEGSYLSVDTEDEAQVQLISSIKEQSRIDP